ncbi:uncharacterized protein LOC117317856 [Pecten maximus]|uniref:uncharacterized protein LOC117317856 n=1 Tax=Pecten maximus TaxID=6579 RepID=UPI0014588475|nr:uncharacterized protein LOC117317856 [Pecten maximus]
MADANQKKRRGPKSYLTESARKRRKKESEQRRGKARVYISKEIDRWRKIKEDLALETDSKLAKLLIDSYEFKKISDKSTTSTGHIYMHSTPARRYIPAQECSESEVTISGSEMSGVFVQESWKDMSLPGPSTSDFQKQHIQKADIATKEASSFINPFDLTIDVTENVDEDDRTTDDEDYEPSFDITLRPNKCEDFEHLAVGDVEFGSESVALPAEEEEREEENMGPGIQRVMEPGQSHIMTDDECFLTYLQPLLTLANVKIEHFCKVKGCKLSVYIKHSVVGSALYLKWVCDAGHMAYRWCSQAVMYRRLHAGDLLISSATLLSGNNFTKLALFAKFLKMTFPSAATFNRVQTSYLVPTISEFWDKEQERVNAEFRGKDVVILGDGRMDSPGHSAQYCTYTAMENETKQIINVVTLDKREADRKSGNMEKLGFQKTMEELSGKGVKVVEAVTDAHTQIGAVMKKNYPNVKHSHDIWHAAKNLGKKLTAECQTKDCRPLKQWIHDVVNHFWHVCQNASTYSEFVGMWAGVLHHVVGEHSWGIPYTDDGVAECSHGPLSDVEAVGKSLEKGSTAHNTLRKVVLYKPFLNKIHYFLNFRSTAELENYHQLILMYAAKRFAYTPPVYKARTILAALDYNFHIDRETKKNADGSVRYHRTYNKKSARWSAVPYKVEKKYSYISDLISAVVEKRLLDREGMHKSKTLSPSDPRHISSVLAPLPPPPTATLVEEKKSRLK